MATEFLIAPAGGGKTQACIERIRVVKRGNPLALVWVLVPNSQAAAQFKARLAAAGASIGVKVGHFPLFIPGNPGRTRAIRHHHHTSALSPAAPGDRARGV